MGVHDEHRKRLRDNYAENGLDSFNNINVLELLLFYTIPRKDTNPIAHNLLDYFGSIEAVFEAPVSELIKVEGVGDNTAIFLKLIPDVAKRYEIEKTLQKSKISNTAEAGEYLIPRFLFEQEEKILVVTLDSQNRVKGCREVGKGIVNAAETNIYKITEAVVKDQASGFILAHNHPGGIAEPSNEDIQMTRHVFIAMRGIGIPLLDHIIIAGRNYYSFADEGIMSTL